MGIYVGISFTYGDKDYTIDSLEGGYYIENPLLLDLGFKTGDKIIEVNNKPVKSHTDVTKSLISAEEFTVERNGTTKKINLPEDFLGQLSSRKNRSSLFSVRVPFMVAEINDT